MQNENGNQTATDNHISAIEDLMLNEVAAAQVKGGASSPQGRLYIGTDQGVYCKDAGTLTLTGVIHG